MQRLGVSVLVTVFVLFISRCSFRSSFVLINKSEKTIKVHYRGHPTGSFIPDIHSKVLSLDEYESGSREWRDYFPEESWSQQVVLPPNQVLLLSTVDVRDLSGESVYKSGIDRLSIETEDGSRQYEGDEVFRQFEPGWTNWFLGVPTIYTITYQ